MSDQSALGLKSDLERCLEQWKAHQSIAPFPLGVHDVSERFQISQKLYGRQEEVAALMDAFERVVSSGAPELLLVSGYSGIGKSSLVRALVGVWRPARGHVRRDGASLDQWSFEDLGRHVGYDNAGTVALLLDATRIASFAQPSQRAAPTAS